MNMLTAKSVVNCPKTKVDVEIRKKCVNCKDFLFMSLKGNTVLIGCKSAEKESKK